jgi:N-acetylglucosamine-6-phosphate deacetylase
MDEGAALPASSPRSHALVLRGGRLLADPTADGPVAATPSDGWVAVDDGLVAALGTGEPPTAAEVVDVGGDWLVPGFVDVHVHGGAGGDVMSPDRAVRDAVRRVHAQHGTTAMLASTVSRPPDELRAAVGRLAEDTGEEPPARVGEPMARLVGIHLEGPFLSALRRGAHEETALRAPDRGELEGLLAAGRGTVRTMTLAPELPGALGLVERLVDAGVVVAVGHTDADADAVRAAVAAGATAVTHTFNAMPPLHHRRPGPVGMAMDLPELVCELVLDLVHVDPVAARALVHAAGPGRVCLVTDAMAAAGAGDGTYELGGRVVEVVDGQARIAGTDTLAGSTLTMATAVANAVTHLGLDVPTAVAMATTVPARLLPGLDVGRLRVGGPADVVRLDDAGRLRGVRISGRAVDRG